MQSQTGSNPQCLCVGNSFLMSLTAQTDPKLELFVSKTSCEILNLLKLSNIFKKGVLSCSLVPDSKIKRRNCRKSSQHLSLDASESLIIAVVTIWTFFVDFVCPYSYFPKVASGSCMLSLYEEPGTTRWFGLEKALLFWVSLFQMDLILNMQSDAALEKCNKKPLISKYLAKIK